MNSSSFIQFERPLNWKGIFSSTKYRKIFSFIIISKAEIKSEDIIKGAVA